MWEGAGHCEPELLLPRHRVVGAQCGREQATANQNYCCLDTALWARKIDDFSSGPCLVRPSHQRRGLWRVCLSRGAFERLVLSKNL